MNPNEPAAIMMQRAKPLAILAGAWPVNGEGEGREVEMLEVDPLPEMVLALNKGSPPTG